MQVPVSPRRRYRPPSSEDKPLALISTPDSSLTCSFGSDPCFYTIRASSCVPHVLFESGLTERIRAGHSIGKRVRGEDLARQPVENILISEPSLHIASFETWLNLPIGTVAYPRRTSTNGQLRFSRPTRSTVFQSSTEASHLSSPPPLPTSQHLLCQLACCRTYVAHHGVVCAQVISSSLFGAWCVSDALSNATHLYT